MHAHDAVKAWTAELDNEPVGHVCRNGPLQGFPEARLLNEACAHAHGCLTSELAWINTLFVGSDARGMGLGNELMRAVVEDALKSGLHPCLEVLPNHPAAMSLYTAMGWRTVHKFRPAWLSNTTGDEEPDVHIMVLTD